MRSVFKLNGPDQDSTTLEKNYPALNLVSKHGSKVTKSHYTEKPWI